METRSGEFSTEMVSVLGDSFVDWLEKGDGIYWINGKGGSGKSTLVNYVTTDSRTTASLNVWTHRSQVPTRHIFLECWN
jgi:ABC-type molybdenum transport system ATPase subunit/photorepair protein PhrA